jgi:hypothetical protein
MFASLLFFMRGTQQNAEDTRAPRGWAGIA